MNPQPSWDDLAEYYADSYAPYDESHGCETSDDVAVERARQEGEFRHVRITPGLRLLDVGCGGGFFLRIAARLGAEVQGIEPSETAASRARATGVPVATGVAEDCAESFGDRRYDLITANHVIEHTPDPIRTLGAMRQMLAMDGTIWIAVPNADCTFRHQLHSRWYSLDVPLHLMQFTMKSLRLAGERAGLRLISVRTHSLPSSTAAGLREVLRRRCLIPLRVTEQVGLFNKSVGPWLARRQDAQLQGEAIIAEFAKED
jgi:2-polyprenyl-3-methyl-5-hydroxy-6-metoxy-1,4-benzoquinol methylase